MCWALRAFIEKAAQSRHDALSTDGPSVSCELPAGSTHTPVHTVCPAHTFLQVRRASQGASAGPAARPHSAGELQLAANRQARLRCPLLCQTGICCCPRKQPPGLLVKVCVTTCWLLPT